MAFSLGLGLLKGAWGATRFATSIPGLIGLALGDQALTGGQGREALGDMLAEPAADLGQNLLSGATGINMERIEDLQQAFSNGNWEALLSNPMLLGVAVIATFALKTGLGNSGFINNAITALMVGGAAYAAQRYLLPNVFNDNAADPNAPAPRLTTTAPATQPATAPEMPEPG